MPTTPLLPLPFIAALSPQEWSAGAVLGIAVVVLYIMFKIGKFFLKLVLFLIAAGLIAGAWWWLAQR